MFWLETTRVTVKSKESSKDFSEDWVTSELSSRKMSERFTLKSQLLCWAKFMAQMETSWDSKAPSENSKEKTKSSGKDTSSGKLLSQAWAVLKTRKESSHPWEAKSPALPTKSAVWRSNLKSALTFKATLKNTKSRSELSTQRFKNSNHKLEPKRLITKDNWEPRTRLSENWKNKFHHSEPQLQFWFLDPFQTWSQKIQELPALLTEHHLHQTLTEWAHQCLQVQAVCLALAWAALNTHQTLNQESDTAAATVDTNQPSMELQEPSLTALRLQQIWAQLQ